LNLNPGGAQGKPRKDGGGKGVFSPPPLIREKKNRIRLSFQRHRLEENSIGKANSKNAKEGGGGGGGGGGVDRSFKHPTRAVFGGQFFFGYPAGCGGGPWAKSGRAFKEIQKGALSEGGRGCFSKNFPIWGGGKTFFPVRANKGPHKNFIFEEVALSGRSSLFFSFPLSTFSLF